MSEDQQLIKSIIELALQHCRDVGNDKILRSIRLKWDSKGSLMGYTAEYKLFKLKKK